MRNLLIAIFLAGMSAHASASVACFDEAAQRYRVDERLLRAIAKTENASFDATLVVKGPGDYEYLGLMMVSSIYLPELNKFGITRQSLLDACINVNIAAWILRRAENRYGQTWKSVGAYNTGEYSANDDAQRRYVRKVWKNYYGVRATDPRKQYGNGIAQGSYASKVWKSGYRE